MFHFVAIYFNWKKKLYDWMRRVNDPSTCQGSLSLSVCVRARLFLYKTLRQNNNVTYFFSYFKINHDCLHTLFVNCSKVNGIYVCVCWFVRWLAGCLTNWVWIENVFKQMWWQTFFHAHKKVSMKIWTTKTAFM